MRRGLTKRGLSTGIDSASARWPAVRVRQTFLDYFTDQTRQHEFSASSSVVPHDDPTLLFANAGMNQFKPLFTGQVATSKFRLNLI